MLSRIPLAHPGDPDLRSPVRFLFWIARGQRRTVIGGAFFGARVDGNAGSDPGGPRPGGRRHHAAKRAGADPLGVGRPRTWHPAGRCRCPAPPAGGEQLPRGLRARAAADHPRGDPARAPACPGRSAPARSPASAPPTSCASARLLDITARGTGALVSIVIVAVILLSTSPQLGLVAADRRADLRTPRAPGRCGQLERRQRAERQQRGAASSVAADTVAGLAGASRPRRREPTSPRGTR